MSVFIDTDPFDVLPGWEGMDHITADAEWPDDIDKDNPAWVEPEIEPPEGWTWAELDRAIEAEADAEWERQRMADPWAYSLIRCGSCHPELLASAS